MTNQLMVTGHHLTEDDCAGSAGHVLVTRVASLLHSQFGTVWLAFLLCLLLSTTARTEQTSGGKSRSWPTFSSLRSEIDIDSAERRHTAINRSWQGGHRDIASQVAQLCDEDRQLSQPRRQGGSQSVNSSADWTRFRGPGGACVSGDKNIPVEWSATQNLAWKLELPGRGASSPVTWRDRVYVTCYTGYGINADAPGDMEKLERHLLCVRRSDGKMLWKATMRSKAAVSDYEGSMLHHGYATHTPTVDQHGIYVFYGSSGAASYTHAGELRWHTSCGKGVHGYGSASSPIVLGNVLIVSAHVESGSIIGLDTRDGRELWRVKASHHVWCTPIVARHNHTTELVCFQEKRHVAGLDPANGRKLWSYQTSTNNVQRVQSSPVQFKDAIITIQGGWGSNSFRFGGSGDVTNSHRQWHSRGIYGAPLVVRDQLIVPFGGVVNIHDARTSETVDRVRMNPSKKGFASAVVADNNLYQVYKDGDVCVIQLGKEPRQVAHNVLEGDTSAFNATPAISNGQLFLRSDKFLYCIQKK